MYIHYIFELFFQFQIISVLTIFNGCVIANLFHTIIRHIHKRFTFFQWNKVHLWKFMTIIINNEPGKFAVQTLSFEQWISCDETVLPSWKSADKRASSRMSSRRLTSLPQEIHFPARCSVFIVFVSAFKFSDECSFRNHPEILILLCLKAFLEFH